MQMLTLPCSPPSAPDSPSRNSAARHALDLTTPRLFFLADRGRRRCRRRLSSNNTNQRVTCVSFRFDGKPPPPFPPCLSPHHLRGLPWGLVVSTSARRTLLAFSNPFPQPLSASGARCGPQRAAHSPYMMYFCARGMPSPLFYPSPLWFGCGVGMPHTGVRVPPSPNPRDRGRGRRRRSSEPADTSEKESLPHPSPAPAPQPPIPCPHEDPAGAKGQAGPWARGGARGAPSRREEE